MRHVLEVQQFDPKLLSTLFSRATKLQSLADSVKKHQKFDNHLSGTMLFNIFYEPSTRTRISFAAAAHHLGMQVITTENAREFSSAIKGESLEDSIRVLCQYQPDVIVLRHYEAGAAKRAAEVSSVPIINAGDGPGQHPTQALLDLYTIEKETGRTNNLTVVLGTDLRHSRTTRSLSYLLSKFKNNHLIFVSTQELRITNDVKSHLRQHNTTFEETENLEYALKKADVVYWNRIQKERFTSSIPRQQFVIMPKHMQLLKADAVLLDPLPRVDQIELSVDQDKRAGYFRQAGNGMFIRMALIEWVMELI